MTALRPVDQELAGMARSPIDQGEWAIPAVVELNGRRLCWQANDPRHAGPAQTRTSTRELLPGLIALRDADDGAVLRFAREWGVLGLCRHGLPNLHPLESLRIVLPGGKAPSACNLVRSSAKATLGYYCEPTDAWRSFADQATSILNIAAALNRDAGVGTDEDWSSLFAYPPDLESRVMPGRVVVRRRWIPQPMDPPASAVSAREELHWLLDKWLKWGGVRIGVRWESDRPSVQQTPAGLFGALAVELANLCTRSDGVAVCSSCGAPYAPRRKPRADRRSYCDACRESGASVRDAQRAQRKRNNQKKREDDE